MIDQQDLVSMLREIASYERGFKQQAFDNAASSIASLDKNRFEIFINEGKYSKLPGVGKSVSECIKEYKENQTISRLDHLREINNKLKYPDFS